MRRLPVVILLIAGALAPAIGVSGASSSAQTGAQPGGVSIRLIEAPSNRADDPRARQYIVDHLAPGSRIERRFEVTNTSSSPTTVELYAAAARLHEGTFVFEDGRASNQLTSWTTVAPPRLNLAPGAKSVATTTIVVPEDVRGGERYAVVWAEPPAASSTSGVRVVNRVGIRIYLSVGGGEEPPTSFTFPTFTATRDEDGRPGVDIEVCNDGGRAIDLAGELLLADGPGGVSAGPFPSDTGTSLGPGQCGTVRVRLDPAIPRGPWNATVNLRSGDDEHSASARITFPADPGGKAAPVKAKLKDVTGTRGGILALLLALLLLLLALLLLWLLWRRRRDKSQDEADV